MQLYNLARVATATTGTGTITLGAAVPGCLTFAQAGVKNGDIVSYGIADSANSEVGSGIYSSTGPTLTRAVLASTNSNNPINLSGTAQVFICILAESVRERLTADRSYFIAPSPTGNDGNNGLSPGSPWATWPKAWAVISALDTQGFNVTVNISDGAYVGPVIINKWWIGGGTVIFQGNATTPASVTLTSTSNNCFTINDAGAGILRLKDFKMQTVTAGDHFFVTAPVKLEYGNLDFGAAPGGSCHFRGFHPGFKINAISNYTISGGGLAHWLFYYGVLEGVGISVTLSGSPAFSSFLFLDNNAKCNWLNGTFTGAAAAGSKKFTQLLLTEIQTGGKGVDFFPGDAGSGTTAISSVYA